MRPLRIAVIGAGPAGLMAALVGGRLGLDVSLYERAPDFRRIGGGLMLHRNGLRALDAVGALQDLLPAMRLTQQLQLRTTRGRYLGHTDLGEQAGPHNQVAVIPRYQLQEHLLTHVTQQGIVPQFDRAVEGYARTGTKAIVQFENGCAEEFDVIVAADGVHSRLRHASGLPACQVEVGEAYLRGIAPLRTPHDEVREIWGPDGRRFGICPLPGGETYFFCTAPLGGWTDVLARRLPAWRESWQEFGTEVMALLGSVEDWSRVSYSELHEVRMARWHQPPLFLVGDAAHAMTPNLGQGANQAIVDSLVLMRLLAEMNGVGDLHRVSQRHEAIRRHCAVRIQTTARHLGRLAQVRWATAQRARDAILAAADRIGWMRRAAMRIATGDNRSEEPYFGRLPQPLSPKASH